MKKIKILFLVSSLGVGGTERNIFNLTLNINKQKFNPVVCCLYDLGEFGRKLSVLLPNLNLYHNIMKNRMDIFAAAWKLIRILKNEKIDIILTESHPTTQFLVVICAKIAGIRANVTRIGGTNLPSNIARKRRIVNKIMLPFVNRIIAQAYSHKEYLISSEGIKPESMTVIYNGVDFEQFKKPYNSESLREEFGISKGVPVVGIVARLSPEKGHEIFLKGVKIILDSFPNVKFLIVGDGMEREILEKMSQELNVKSNVYFTGFRKDIPCIVSMFDIAVLVSFPVRETFSNSILEYMASDKPVVATNVGSMAELVKDGETGLLVPYGKPDKLSEAILDLLKNSDKANRMGKAGRERIEKMFTLEQMVANYEALFESLVG